MRLGEPRFRVTNLSVDRLASVAYQRPDAEVITTVTAMVPGVYRKIKLGDSSDARKNKSINRRGAVQPSQRPISAVVGSGME
jgi:hypothetical protein